MVTKTSNIPHTGVPHPQDEIPAEVKTTPRPSVETALPLSSTQHIKRLQEEWSHFVGPAVNEYARPVHLEQHTLVIRVKSPVWMQELGYLKGRYIQQINESLGFPLVRQLRFELGDLPAAPHSPLPTPPPPKWLADPLPPEWEEEIERKLSHLPNDALKESARRIMRKHYKLTRLHRNKRPRR